MIKISGKVDKPTNSAKSFCWIRCQRWFIHFSTYLYYLVRFTKIDHFSIIYIYTFRLENITTVHLCTTFSSALKHYLTSLFSSSFSFLFRPYFCLYHLLYSTAPSNIKYRYPDLKRSIWSIDEVIIGFTIPCQSGPGSNCVWTGWKLITNNRLPTSVSSVLTNKSTVVTEKIIPFLPWVAVFRL